MGEALPKFDVKQMVKNKKKQPSSTVTSDPEVTTVVELPKQKAKKKTTPKKPTAKKPVTKKPATKKRETKLRVIKQKKAVLAGQFTPPEVNRDICSKATKAIKVKFESTGATTLTMTPQVIMLNKFYDYFNMVLFNNELSPCMVRFEKERKYGGVYRHSDSGIWYKKEKGKTVTIPEITLNHKTLVGLKKDDILAILVHEMCHHWEHTVYKNVSNREVKSGYHSVEFAQKMESVGLVCSATGLPDGKKTGRSMSHYIKGGSVDPSPKTGDQGFLKAFKYLPKTWKFPWETDITLPTSKPKKPTNKNKVKYICPEWSKETNDCLGHFWMKGDVDPELVWTCSVHNVKAEPEQKG